LESGEFIRVGSSKVQKTDVRVIAATNRELLQFVQAAKFREDLYYRLSTVPIRVPALRDRKEDIPLLFRKFVVDFSERYKTIPVQLDDAARQQVINYPWPGNVRELKNIAEQISVLASDKHVDAAEITRFLPEHKGMNHLPVLAGNGQPSGEFNNERDILYKLFFDMKPAFIKEVKELQTSDIPQPLLVTSNVPASHTGQPMIVHNNNDIHEHEEVEESLNIMDKEKELIIKALKKHRGKRKDAAMDLGISERTLYRKLKEYDIDQ
jgi:DNA-binding NtrC family response regulator